jgi:hypothetical protein
MIRRLTISPGRGGQKVVDLTVQVRSPEVITQFEDRLRDSFHDVVSQDVSERSSSDDYPWQFETRITLTRRDKEDYQRPESTPQADGDIASSTVVKAHGK